MKPFFPFVLRCEFMCLKSQFECKFFCSHFSILVHMKYRYVNFSFLQKWLDIWFWKNPIHNSNHKSLTVNKKTEILVSRIQMKGLQWKKYELNEWHHLLFTKEFFFHLYYLFNLTEWWLMTMMMMMLKSDKHTRIT